MKSTWDLRIRRATELTDSYPFAAEGLRFYIRVATVQQRLYSQFQQAPADLFSHERLSWDRLEMSALLPRFSGFLADIRSIAPATFAQTADQLIHRGAMTWLALIDGFLRAPACNLENDENKQFAVAELCLAWLFLQPFAECFAARQTRMPGGGSPVNCPFCGAKPIVGVLRQEGDGAKKSLICMLCAYEWPFRRVYCPACAEERETQLAFYSAPEIPHVRVDVCDTCHTYLKSVDLTKTGLAVPAVDEIASLPLDLWSRDNGYHKLQMNILGI
jgi:formate dehydrogenase accessory protein FdhE